MSAYTTKASLVDRDYIVIKHAVPNVNGVVLGVKFRDGWAVVEKDSKTYHRIKKLPMMKTLTEMPLDFLNKLPFITRALDVKLIYGADVYAKYINFITKKEKVLEEKSKEEEIEAHLSDETKCKFQLKNGAYCKHNVQDSNVSPYCPIHILKDPTLQEIDFVIPLAMTKNQRKKLRKTAFNKLKAHSKKKEQSDVEVD